MIMQEEIKEILDRCTPFLFGDEVDKLYDYITNLQEENERLNMVVTIQEDYKSRNEKAIEYIKEKAINNCWIDQYEANDLLNILQGVDKE